MGVCVCGGAGVCVIGGDEGVLVRRVRMRLNNHVRIAGMWEAS